ncbi:alpha-tocopherol transfer protein-like [Toxorhynchites rutilus septentrionalis]|uniref:alpha-tocopherol transfer protein-like n=1 Tax=Toxorhynchites rutilus septentrionalis TaxID=329112 RepID=UPI002478C7CD|nr:alpha-tocopherol transfer protein-like [Toxorhynchites rutilus septentrionalis]
MANVRLISPELTIVAERDLNEDPTQLRSHLEVIRTWLSEHSTIQGALSDQILLSFLRGCKFSLEKTKQKLALFYRIRTMLPEVVQNRDPLAEDVLQLIRLGVGTPLPETVLPTDPKIFIIRVCQFDLEKCTFADVIKVGTMINDILIRDDDQMVVCGITLIIDLANVTASHLFQFEVEFLKQVAVLYQDASPLRMQAIHILNPPPGMHTVLNIFNSLVADKNKDKRIFAHGTSLDSLHKLFPACVLPEEYGGTLGPIQTFVDLWVFKLKENRNYLLEMTELQDNSIVSNSKIPTNNSHPRVHNHFGLDGSFRKLELD